MGDDAGPVAVGVVAQCCIANNANLAVRALTVAEFTCLEIDDEPGPGVVAQSTDMWLVGEAGHADGLSVPVKPDRCDVGVPVNVERREMADDIRLQEFEDFALGKRTWGHGSFSHVASSAEIQGTGIESGGSLVAAESGPPF